VLGGAQASERVGVTILVVAEPVSAGQGITTFVGTTGPSNKGMKLTKPSILELRSLSLVFGRLLQVSAG
jgi:hypothetical protein